MIDDEVNPSRGRVGFDKVGRRLGQQRPRATAKRTFVAVRYRATLRGAVEVEENEPSSIKRKALVANSRSPVGELVERLLRT